MKDSLEKRMRGSCYYDTVVYVTHIIALTE